MAKDVTIQRAQRMRSKERASREIVPRASGSMAKRAAANRAINQRVLREAIAAGGHHRKIVDTLDQVTALHDSIRTKRTMTKEEQAAFMSKLAALKTKMDAQFRLLAKYLPDLRSIEFREGEGETNPFASAARAWAEALSKDA